MAHATLVASARVVLALRAAIAARVAGRAPWGGGAPGDDGALDRALFDATQLEARGALVASVRDEVGGRDRDVM